jgi:Sulfotransferase family
MEPASLPTNPIFIVGCPRSGTTLMRRIIASHSRISCGPETLFLREIATTEGMNWMRLARFGLTQDEWRAHVRELFVWVHEQYAARQGKPRWADKSPAYALIVEYINSLFPDCQVIHVIRDPRDVLDSWVRRWGYLSGRTAVGAWPSHVKSAREFGARHGPDRYYEVRYEELVNDPEKVVKALMEWLGEPWEDQVLNLERSARKRSPRTSEDERRMWLGDKTELPDDLDTSASQREALQRDHSRDALGIFTSSVGTSRKAKNLPYLAQLYVTAGPLMRELGYL